MPEPTTEQGTTTPESTTEQATTTPEPTTEQGTTMPEPTTEQASTTPEPTTEQATTTPEPTTEQVTTTSEPSTGQATTPSQTPAAPCYCQECVEKKCNSLEFCKSLGLDCDCVQGTTTLEPTTEQATTTQECLCDRCLGEGNPLQDCQKMGMDCGCVRTLPVPLTTAPGHPCLCDQCVKAGNTIQECKTSAWIATAPRICWFCCRCRIRLHPRYLWGLPSLGSRSSPWAPSRPGSLPTAVVGVGGLRAFIFH